MGNSTTKQKIKMKIEKEERIAIIAIIIFILLIFNPAVNNILMSLFNINLFGGRSIEYNFGGLVMALVIGLIAIMFAKAMASRISK